MKGRTNLLRKAYARAPRGFVASLGQIAHVLELDYACASNVVHRLLVQGELERVSRARYRQTRRGAWLWNRKQ